MSEKRKAETKKVEPLWKTKPNGLKTMVKSGMLSPDNAVQNLINRGAMPNAPIFGWLKRYKKRLG